MTTKKLLITGIPGMGKTTVGDYLSKNHNYKHINFEDGVSLNSFIQNAPKFINDEFNELNTVVTWGFTPDNQASIVKYIESLGFKLTWFDGNRVVAFREYLKAGRQEAPFYYQMYRIETSNVIRKIEPYIYNTFDQDGKFKKLETIVQEIESILI